MLKSRPRPSASQLDSRGKQPSHSARTTATAWRAARLLIAPSVLVATFAFSCSDDDETVTSPTGGSGGQGATGGSAGLGGSGGNGGSSVAGAAGSGGSAGSGAGAGGAAGSSAGAAGAAGTAGVGNDPDAGDGGPDPDSGTVQLTPQQQTAQTICGRLDDVASCQAAPSDCQQATIDLWEAYKSTVDTSISGCTTAVVDTFEDCIATDSTAVFDCLGGTNSDGPEVSDQTGGGCEDEQTAMFSCFPP